MIYWLHSVCVNASKDVGEVLMSVDDCQEKDIKDTAGILKFIESLKEQSVELILSSDGESVGAILTGAQYKWFLDQLDSQQDVESIHAKADNRDGSQSLDDFKKELDI